MENDLIDMCFTTTPAISMTGGCRYANQLAKRIYTCSMRAAQQRWKHRHGVPPVDAYEAHDRLQIRHRTIWATCLPHRCSIPQQQTTISDAALDLLGPGTPLRKQCFIQPPAIVEIAHLTIDTEIPRFPDTQANRMFQKMHGNVRAGD
eukprot:scaffold38504_cov17-Prasinocladus_malaysianus.AAC.3